MPVAYHPASDIFLNIRCGRMRMQFTTPLPSEGVMAFVAVAAVAVAVGVSGTGPVSPQSTQDSASQESNVLTWEGHITVKQVRDGDVVDTWEDHNILTMQGQQWIRRQIGEGLNDDTNATVSALVNDATNVSFIALGNGSAPVAATQQLDQEIGDGEPNNGLERQEGTQTNFPSAGEFQIQNTFTATSDIGVVNTTALNWNVSGPSIVSGGAFGTEANILADDQLTVTHNITIS